MDWKQRSQELEALRKKHGRTARPDKRRWKTDFPNLKIEQNVAPCGNGFGSTAAWKES